MNTLLVGGSGFLGKQILHNLTLAGHEVTVMNRQTLSETKCGQFQADIFTPESYRNQIRELRPQWVIQTAWVSQSENYRNSSKNDLYRRATIDFAVHCFELEVEHLMILGSSAEYGNQALPCDSRRSVPMPIDPYGKSKLETFEILSEATQGYSSSFTWPRIFQAYGKGQDSNRFIPKAVNSLITGIDMQVDNPESIFDWISSRDIASALLFCLDNRIDGSVDIGTGVSYSVEDVLKQLHQLIGVSGQQSRAKTSIDEFKSPSSLTVSPSSLIFEKGWSPSDDLIAGLKWVLET
jgi:nucleoside-diphosphate-sugar epimerase